MIKRKLKQRLEELLDKHPAVALLGIDTLNELMGHPVVGGSWEGYVIENIAGVLPERASMGFYRTKGGAEVDLVIDPGGGELWAIEIKRSTAPTIAKGFHIACEDLKPDRKFAVYGGDESFPIGGGIQVVSLRALMERVAERN